MKREDKNLSQYNVPYLNQVIGTLVCAFSKMQ